MHTIPSRFGLSLAHGLLLASVMSAPQALAGDPCVVFDLPETIACHIVTPTETNAHLLSAAPSGERMIEATFLLSVRVRAGDANAIEEASIVISSPSKSFQVVDFLPRTQLVSEIIGEIEQTTTTDNSSGLSASLGGSLPVPYGKIVAQVAPSASANTSQQKVTIESKRRLPPLDVAVVSGTTDRGRGVFFKMRRTPQNTLEGVHELTVRFAVSKEWRIGRVNVQCRASGREKVLWFKQNQTWSKATLPVVLYEDDNPRAKAAADEATEQTSL